ncbi:unnamed protein product [Pleuronectes platessa]|uniref:Uncharacterized protein n=1 Tax=Pleuronectes platessa TaxID=8262 RepID=A0A9N7TM88_PLEPL|nr:unnamed protein product [Pleuronectes platessa]
MASQHSDRRGIPQTAPPHHTQLQSPPPPAPPATTVLLEPVMVMVLWFGVVQASESLPVGTRSSGGCLLLPGLECTGGAFGDAEPFSTLQEKIIPTACIHYLILPGYYPKLTATVDRFQHPRLPQPSWALIRADLAPESKANDGQRASGRNGSSIVAGPVSKIIGKLQFGARAIAEKRQTAEGDLKASGKFYNHFATVKDRRCRDINVFAVAERNQGANKPVPRELLQVLIEDDLQGALSPGCSSLYSRYQYISCSPYQND